MSEQLAMGLMALMGSGLGTLGGIIASAKLTNHRIKELEQRVAKHNDVISRTFVLEEKVKVAHNRIDNVERRLG